MADVECCICSKETNWFQNGYEKLTKIVTLNGIETLKAAAIRKNDKPSLIASLVYADTSTVVTSDLYYHFSCYRDYTREESKTTGSGLHYDLEAAEKFFSEIEEIVIVKKEVLPTEELECLYKKHDNLKTPNKKSLLTLILERFEDNVALWTSKRHSFLYNNNLDKGEIIDIMLQKVKLLESKIKPKSDEQIVKESGQIIRKEILDMADTYSEWPPSADSLISNETKLPDSLNSLLTNVLCSRPPTAKKRRLIDSFGQDIIYAATNGAHRTEKHTLLPLCTKRKTGSKDMLQWLNRSGHGISYDEVRFVETNLAEKAVMNQRALDYVPSTLHPKVFLTFVWDNNDINPDSLKGEVMHCTNGIAIQIRIPARSQVPATSPPPAKSTRNRSFKPIVSSLPHYITKKRETPTHLSSFTESGSETINLSVSSYIDFLWVLLKEYKETIPAWTGFNYSIQGSNSSR